MHNADVRQAYGKPAFELSRRYHPRNGVSNSLTAQSRAMLNEVLAVVLGIFIDSFLFVFLTAVVSQGLGVNDSKAVCSAAISLCLAFYVTTKVMIYLFLVERVVSR
jgi:hypothetical protein